MVEADDFASGTSSRSSKLVHGELRYLKNAQIKVTLESVREREYLLKQGRGLVNRLGFLYGCLKGDGISGWIFGAGLAIYDIMAGHPLLCIGSPFPCFSDGELLVTGSFQGTIILR